MMCSTTSICTGLTERARRSRPSVLRSSLTPARSREMRRWASRSAGFARRRGHRRTHSRQSAPHDGPSHVAAPFRAHEQGSELKLAPDGVETADAVRPAVSEISRIPVGRCAAACRTTTDSLARSRPHRAAAIEPLGDSLDNRTPDRPLAVSITYSLRTRKRAIQANHGRLPGAAAARTGRRAPAAHDHYPAIRDIPRAGHLLRVQPPPTGQNLEEK